MNSVWIRGSGRTPGALDDAGDFHVVAVVAAAQHRAERDRLGPGQRRLSEPPHDRRLEVRREPAADGPAFDFDESPRRSSRQAAVAAVGSAAARRTARAGRRG